MMPALHRPSPNRHRRSCSSSAVGFGPRGTPNPLGLRRKCPVALRHAQPLAGHNDPTCPVTDADLSLIFKSVLLAIAVIFTQTPAVMSVGALSSYQAIGSARVNRLTLKQNRGPWEAVHRTLARLATFI